jgi:hypothetical protein
MFIHERGCISVKHTAAQIRMSSRLKGKCVFHRVRLTQIITLVSSAENPERGGITGAYRIKATRHKVSGRAEGSFELQHQDNSGENNLCSFLNVQFRVGVKFHTLPFWR